MKKILLTLAAFLSMPSGYLFSQMFTTSPTDAVVPSDPCHHGVMLRSQRMGDYIGDSFVKGEATGALICDSFTYNSDNNPCNFCVRQSIMGRKSDQSWYYLSNTSAMPGHRDQNPSYYDLTLQCKSNMFGGYYMWGNKKDYFQTYLYKIMVYTSTCDDIDDDVIPSSVMVLYGEGA